MLLFLLALPQQLHDIAGLGDFGEVNLRLHFRRRRPLPGGGAGLGRKVLTNLFRFILLK
jgi:hypothetical protein